MPSLKRKLSYPRINAFARGQIWDIHCAEVARETIRGAVAKLDGEPPSLQTIENTIAKEMQDPVWRGEDEETPGRPKLFTQVRKAELYA